LPSEVIGMYGVMMFTRRSMPARPGAARRVVERPQPWSVRSRCQRERVTVPVIGVRLTSTEQLLP
jgi:hypothetical protein